jgi:endonuclease/exonuclease/phosphatase family metal-dependent hydrolase
VSALKPAVPFPEVANHRDKGIEIVERTSRGDDLCNQSSLVLATYNIRYAVGSHLVPSGLLRKAGLSFPQPRAAAVAKNIKHAAKIFSGNSLLPRPDILALQEADKATGRAGQQHVAAKLAEEMNVSYAHVGAGLPRGVMPEQREWWLNFEEQIGLHDPGDTGVALLSRVPLHEITRIDLPWHQCMWRPRLAMGATFELAAQPVRLFNVHVDPHGPLDNQHQQLEALIETAGRGEGVQIILGDFNTLSKQKAVEIRRLMEAHGYSTPFPTGTPTWRGAGLRFHADWIFVKGLEVKRFGVVKPLRVSDHWPIWAEVALPE